MLEENTNVGRVLYSSIQKRSRVLVPKIFFLFSLSVVFYVGVLLVLSLLKLDGTQETMFKIGSLIFLILVVLLGIYLSYKHSKKKYIFYGNRIYFNKNEVKYNTITNVISKHNLWDKLFKTYSLKLNDDFSVRHISIELELENYVKEMIRYSKGDHLIEKY